MRYLLLGVLLCACGPDPRTDPQTLCKNLKLDDDVLKFPTRPETTRTVKSKGANGTANISLIGPRVGDLECCLAATPPATCGALSCSDPVVANGVQMLIQGMTRISDGNLECGLWVVDGKVKAAWQINNF